jgi:hypothetical protein
MNSFNIVKKKERGFETNPGLAASRLEYIMEYEKDSPFFNMGSRGTNYWQAQEWTDVERVIEILQWCEERSFRLEDFEMASSMSTGFVASILHDMAVCLSSTVYAVRVTYLCKSWFFKSSDASLAMSNICRMVALLWTEHPDDRMDAVIEVPQRDQSMAEVFLTHDRPSEPEFVREQCKIDRLQVDVTFMEDPIHVVFDVCGQPLTCAVTLRQIPSLLREMLLLGPVAMAIRGYEGWFQCVKAYPNVSFGLCVRCDWDPLEGGYTSRIVRMVLCGRAVWCSFYYGDGSDLTPPVDVLRSYQWPVEFVEALFGGTRQMKRLSSGAHLEIGAQTMAELIHRHLALGGRCYVLDTEKIPMHLGGPYDVTDWHVVSLVSSYQRSGDDAKTLLDWWEECKGESATLATQGGGCSPAILLLVKGIGREIGVFKTLGIDLTLRSYGSLWSGILDITSLVAGEWIAETGKKHLARNGVYQKAMHVMRAIWRTERLTHSVYGLYEDEWKKRVMALPILRVYRPFLISRYIVKVPLKLRSTHKVAYAPIQSWPKYIRSGVSTSRDVIPMDCSVFLRDNKPTHEEVSLFFKNDYHSRLDWKHMWSHEFKGGLGYCVWLLDIIEQGHELDFTNCGRDNLRAYGMMLCETSPKGAYALTVFHRLCDLKEEENHEVWVAS